MALQIYEKGVVLLNGQILMECQNISVDHSAALNPIHTQIKGFAGVSPGSPMMKASIESAIPRAGMEFDYLTTLQGVQVVTLVLFRGSKKVKSNGFLDNMKESYGADRGASCSVDFIGEPADQSTL